MQIFFTDAIRRTACMQIFFTDAMQRTTCMQIFFTDAMRRTTCFPGIWCAVSSNPLPCYLADTGCSGFYSSSGRMFLVVASTSTS